MTATPEAFARVRALAAGLPPVVCYHHPCADGVFAALAAHAHFSRPPRAAPAGAGTPQQQQQRPRFVPLSVFKQPSVDALGLTGRECVYLLDYSGPPGFARELARRAARVVVLDHHKTAAEQLGVNLPGADAAAEGQPPQQQPGRQQQQEQQQGPSHATGSEAGGGGGPDAPQGTPEPLPANVHALLDMGRSGAVLALDYFGREGLSPDLIRAFGLVQDADLWAWKLPGSREFHAGLSSLGLEYDAASNPGVFGQLTALDVDDVIAKGTAVLEEQTRHIAAAVAAAERVTLGGPAAAGRGWGSALGCFVTGDLVGWRSALGNALARRSQELGLTPAGVVAYVESGMAPGEVKVSLRSVGGWDTTAVTQALGGGGHRAASSCIVPAADWEAWRAEGNR